MLLWRCHGSMLSHVSFILTLISIRFLLWSFFPILWICFHKENLFPVDVFIELVG